MRDDSEPIFVGWDAWYFGFKNSVFHKGLVVREGEVPPEQILWAGIPYLRIGTAPASHKAYYKLASSVGSETEITNVQEAEAEIFATRLLNGPITSVSAAHGTIGGIRRS